MMMGEISFLKSLVMVKDLQEIMVDVFILGEEVVAALALAAFSTHSLLVGSWERPSLPSPSGYRHRRGRRKKPFFAHSPIHPSILFLAAISGDWGAYRSLIGQSVSGAWCEKTGGPGRKAREVNMWLRITRIRLGSEGNEGQVLSPTTLHEFPRLPGCYQEAFIGS